MKAVLYLSEETLIGEGATKEEAMQNCLAQVADYIGFSVEVAGVEMGLEFAERISGYLKIVPSGYSLVLLERCSHSDGQAYDKRYFTVECGRTIYGPGLGKGKRVTKLLEVISFCDSNSEYHFKLPPGSLEYTEERGWQPARKAKYYY